MALVKMTRLTAVAIQSDKQKLFDQIVKSGCVEMGECEQIEYKTSEEDSKALEKLYADINYLQTICTTIASAVDSVNAPLPKDKHIALPSTTMSHPRYELSFDDFKNIANIKDDVMIRGKNVVELSQKREDMLAEIKKLESERDALTLFLPLERSAEFFVDTSHTFVALGIVPRESIDALEKAFAVEDLADIERLNEVGSEILVSVYCHKSLENLWNSLSKYGFRRAELKANVLPRVTYAELTAEINTLVKKAEDCNQEIVSDLELYEKCKLVSDFLALSVKEIECNKGMNDLGHSFVFTAYLPEEDKEKVEKALTSVTDNIILQFDEIGDDEFAPTLCRNNKVVTPFESVTNMYMPPNYHEPDPNPIMSVFYFLIFGLMTADLGYGLVLAFGGLILSNSIKQNTGMKQLSGLIGVCGFATMLWGFLFGSFFCMDMSTWFVGMESWYPILPSPSDYPIVTMALSLVLGILHIMAGVVSNALKQIKQKHVADAIIDNLPWLVFFVGLLLLAAQPACSMICDSKFLANVDNGTIKQTHLIALVDFASSEIGAKLLNVGLYVIVGAMVFVAFTAGRHNKGLFGKLKGGFGGVYGVINYFSDVVSYVRIFGLMLSGAVFGSIINQIVEQMLFPMGVVGYIFGGVVLVLFHAFNLALAVLGAYVHNARLQYVEYFGKFYEGEGSLFRPLGSDLEYTLIKNN